MNFINELRKQLEIVIPNKKKYYIKQLFKKLDKLQEMGSKYPDFGTELENYSTKDIKRIVEYIEYNEKDNKVFKKSFIFKTGDNPVPSARPQAARRGKFVVVYDPKNNKMFKSQIRSQVELKIGDDWQIVAGSLEVSLNVYKYKKLNKTEMFLAAIGYYRPEQKPDVDNYAKIVLDAVQGSLFLDDGQCTKLVINKWFSNIPRIEFDIKFRFNKMKSKGKK